MSENKEYEAGFGSNSSQNPVRIVFLTKKTSAKVTGAIRKQAMSYPHVVLREIIAFQILCIVLVLISLFWDAPLEQLANPLLTPNPAKAPWYFLGLQELLHYFPPIVAGVLIPALIVVALVVIPYFNVNVQGEALWAAGKARRLRIFLAAVVFILIFSAIYEAWTVLVSTVLIAGFAFAGYFIPPGRGMLADFLRSRTLPWWVMTWFILMAVILTLVGTFFRGPGWSWVWPWR